MKILRVSGRLPFSPRPADLCLSCTSDSTTDTTRLRPGAMSSAASGVCKLRTYREPPSRGPVLASCTRRTRRRGEAAIIDNHFIRYNLHLCLEGWSDAPGSRASSTGASPRPAPSTPSPAGSPSSWKHRYNLSPHK